MGLIIDETRSFHGRGKGAVTEPLNEEVLGLFHGFLFFSLRY